LKEIKDGFIEFAEDKGVAVIEVGKTNKDVDKKLINMGYKVGEKVLVVVQ
jgi:Mrp family chromosome partitioning ATPase